MDTRGVELLGVILNSWWYLMTSWKLPILNITPAQGLMFIFIVPLTVRFMKDLLSVSTHYTGKGNEKN